jgi:hypothetical protein
MQHALTKEYQDWLAWTEENEPEKTFIAKHGMRSVPCGEFWRD